jgi:hypothetical protein
MSVGSVKVNLVAPEVVIISLECGKLHGASQKITITCNLQPNVIKLVVEHDSTLTPALSLQGRGSKFPSF